MIKTRAPSLLGLLLLPACVPLSGVEPMRDSSASKAYAAAQSFKIDRSEPWPSATWWTAYGDPQLDGLIGEALSGSPDLAAAVARVRRAEALAQQANAARLPQLDLAANGGATKQSYNNGIPATFVPKGWNDAGNVHGALGFDLDLWGRNRSALMAARFDSEAARLDHAQVTLMLSTSIASAYADLARLFAERAVQLSALEVREQTYKLVGDRVRSGLDTQAELKQASAAVPATRSDLAATDEQIALTRNRLAALLGAGPDRGLTIAAPSVAMTEHGLPENATTALIGRRPDVAAARARVEAEAARIKVARADFYPALNLSALVGYQSLGLTNLLRGGSTYGSVGPAVSLPIFHGGALKARYKSAHASFDEAAAAYDQTVTEAYRTVADAVASRRSLAIQLTQSQQSLADFQAAHTIAVTRYEGGLSTFLDVLNAQDRTLQAQRLVADLKSRAFKLDIDLVRALGGGFLASDKPDGIEPKEVSNHG